MHRPRLVVAAVALCALAGCSSGGSGPATTPIPAGSSTPVARPPVSSPAAAATPATTAVAPATTAVAPATTAPSTRSPSRRPSPTTPKASTAAPTRRTLPLPGATGDAEQVITVVVSSHASTTAQLQAWTRTSSGWRRSGPVITAHVGAGGVGTTREGLTRTPAGSFTLTQAFGHDADPGTRLPYVRTTPADWWISQIASPLYNTRQRCRSSCAFTRGDPNEHLYYETPYYDYAVVIDYNTANAPGGVRPGAGSAFFLHVTDGGPTAGCVSIPQARLVAILRWLRPAAHPRILIGVT